MTDYKDIKVYCNGRLSRSSTWISISKLGSDLCYLSFDEGRVYFSLLSNPGDEIVNLNHDDERQSVTFRYIGWWEDEDDFTHGGENVNLLFEIIFNNSDDYASVRDIWQKAEKIHPNEDFIKLVE